MTQTEAIKNNEQHISSMRSLGLRRFWLLAFIFCSLQALMVQKLILPLFPSLHAGHGLMVDDAILFHDVASAAADRIRSVGWSEWSIYPPGFTGNVGLLSALYAVFGPNPAIFIPFNAAAHATGGLMLYLMGPLLWPGRIGRTGGLAAAVLFVIFPSALLWYSQNHKDAFTIAGILIILYTWLRIISMPQSNQVDWRSLPLAFAGVSLVLVFRPYLSILIGCAFIFSWLAVLGCTVLKKSPIVRSGYSSTALSFIAIVVVAAIVGGSLPATESTLKISDSGTRHKGNAITRNWNWKPSRIVPVSLEAPFRKISEIRVHFIEYGQSVGAGSSIDQNEAPDSVWAALGYLPRATLVGSLSPYPNSWTERVSVPRLIAAMETLLWYFLAAGLAVLVYRRPSAALIGGLVFSFFMISVLSYITPNIGTLYRVRFGYWMFILLGGSIGWASLLPALLNRNSVKTDKASLPSIVKTENRKVISGISRLAAAGSVAMGMTFVCFLGFLARDLLLINRVGMGEELDIFFAAAMLPMVFVTCLVMPMTDVLTKPFLTAYQSHSQMKAQDIISGFLGIGILVSTIAISVLFIAGSQAIGLFTSSKSHVISSYGQLLLRLFSPIILFSVWTILGNTVLNSRNKSAQAAGAQLIVPICVIVAITLASSEVALLAGTYGMLGGTALNAAIVSLLCWRQGIRMWPSWFRRSHLGANLRSYLWLAFGAMFSALLVPMNYYFASKVGEGSVSAWAFTSKIIILINSIFGFGVTSVVLPYLARKFNWQRNSTGRNQLYLLQVAGTWVGGFISLALAIFAEPLVFALLSTDNKITEEQIVGLARVLRLCALQVPLAIASVIALKSAAVSGADVRASLASLCGLSVNMLLNWWLVPICGLEGIAFGTLGALMVNTVLLNAGLRSGYGMSLLFGVLLLTGWFVWVGAAWAIDNNSSLGMMAAAGGLVVLAYVQWLFWSQNLHHRQSLRNHDALHQ